MSEENEVFDSRYIRGSYEASGSSESSIQQEGIVGNSTGDASDIDEVDELYKIGKPRRIIIRGIIIHE